MTLYLVSWLAVTWSVLPPRLGFGIEQAIASDPKEARRLVADHGGIMLSISKVQDGRIRKLSVEWNPSVKE